MISFFENKVDKKALADAYSSMMQSSAWLELESYAKAELGASIVRMDSKSASDLSLGEVCEERGLRKGIMKILNHAKQCEEGV